jgi:hypothetical protein
VLSVAGRAPERHQAEDAEQAPVARHGHREDRLHAGRGEQLEVPHHHHVAALGHPLEGAGGRQVQPVAQHVGQVAARAHGERAPGRVGHRHEAGVAARAGEREVEQQVHEVAQVERGHQHALAHRGARRERARALRQPREVRDGARGRGRGRAEGVERRPRRGPGQGGDARPGEHHADQLAVEFERHVQALATPLDHRPHAPVLVARRERELRRAEHVEVRVRHASEPQGGVALEREVRVLERERAPVPGRAQVEEVRRRGYLLAETRDDEVEARVGGPGVVREGGELPPERLHRARRARGRERGRRGDDAAATPRATRRSPARRRRAVPRPPRRTAGAGAEPCSSGAHWP